jgi:long-chain acyl-CoA synthetase
MADTLPALFFDRAAQLGGQAALRVDGDAGAALSWSRWAAASMACARALVADGFQPGDGAAIIAANGPLWPVADIGVLAAGMLSIGVYPASSPEQVGSILRDAGVSVVFVDSTERVPAVLEAAATLPALRRIVLAPSAAVLASVRGVTHAAHGQVAARTAAQAAADPPLLLEWDAWLRAGGWGLQHEVEERISLLEPGAPAVVIYTSGSTGEPKGALLSHRYLLESAASIAAAFELPEGGRMLSFLPFSHAAERVFGHVTRIARGTEAVLVPDPRTVWDAAVRHEPTVFGGLPRYYEKLHAHLAAARAGLHGSAAAAWDHALELGRLRSELRRRGEPVPRPLHAEWRAARAPIAARIAERLGGAIQVVTSGGAALPRHVVADLDAAGLTVLGAFGLTEHLCVASHRPGRYGFDSVGVPMPGTELRVDATGEVLVRRCGLTFSGYLGRPRETAEAFTEDGAWLRTGDLGAIGEDGALRITGRRKELIALSTGRKVAPAPIEARLAEHPLIGSAVLFGEGRKYVTALLALRAEGVARWALEHGRGVEGLAADPAVLEELQRAVESINASLSPQERVCRFALLDRELSLDAGELTPTLKVRRDVVAALHHERLESLYGEAP